MGQQGVGIPTASLFQSHDLPGSPVTVTSVAGPISTPFTVAQGSGLSLGDICSPSALRVIARDEFGNFQSASDSQFILFLYKDDFIAEPGSIIYLGNGQYSASYTPPYSGPFKMSIGQPSLSGLAATYYSLYSGPDCTIKVASSTVKSDNFNVPFGAYPSASITSDVFCIIFRGFISPYVSGIYQFYAIVPPDGIGISMRINGQLVMDSLAAPNAAVSGIYNFPSVVAQFHDIRIEYRSSGPSENSLSMQW